jgi:hypothetical protein
VRTESVDPQHGSDAEAIRELELIQQRLAALVSDDAEREDLGNDLQRIRADLRRLAEDHAEIQARIAPLLEKPEQ